jgi:hypothetical protein
MLLKYPCTLSLKVTSRLIWHTAENIHHPSYCLKNVEMVYFQWYLLISYNLNQQKIFVLWQVQCFITINEDIPYYKNCSTKTVTSESANKKVVATVHKE